MSSSNTEEGTTNIGAYVPLNHAEALFQLKQLRTSRKNRVTQSDLIRDAIGEYLAREVQKEGVPGEIADLVDDDLIANAGGEK